MDFLKDIGLRDELGVINGFRKLCEIYIKQLVDEGKWFTICHKIDKNQVDIMQLTNDDGVKLGTFISDVFEEGSYRSSIYKYMLMNYMCYVEIPTVKYRTDMGENRQTFDKMLVTSNVEVIASWLECEVDELDSKYKSRVYAIDVDDGDDNIPYVKLTETAKEGKKKVTCPRKDLDISQRGTRVVPIFMLKSGVDALYKKLSEDVVKVTFLKDNGQVRDMFTTVNMDKVKEVYGVCDFYSEAVDRTYNGNFLGNRNITRGYIRVPEIGGSKYGGATRSINYARIINIDYEEEPNLSFINIDLSTVVDGFQNGVQKHFNSASEIVDMLEAFGIDGGCWRGGKDGEKARFLNKDLVSLLTWSEERSMLFSTVFLRELCMFMLSNPQWFGDFTGKPRYVSGSGGDVGLA